MLAQWRREVMLCLGVTGILLLSLTTVSCASDRQQLRVGDSERRFIVRVPPVRSAALLPLVLVLHGGGGNARNAEEMTGFTPKAMSEGFIVAYPDGSGRFNERLLTWNAGHCCGYAMKNQVNDVAFIAALLDHLIATYPVDPNRIYLTGISNGGMMVHRLGIELSGRLAAIAPVVATLFGDEPMPAYPVSALMLNGMRDESVPYLGGVPGGPFASAWDGTPARPALAQAEYWAKATGCSSPAKVTVDGVRHDWRYACPEGRAVALILLGDGGHAWPGGKPGTRWADTPSTGLSATDVIWRFFQDKKSVIKH